jgi:hypothetical protein
MTPITAVSTILDPRTVMTVRGVKKVEAAPGFEPGITVLQTVALAAWLCRRPSRAASVPVDVTVAAAGKKNGAGNGIRTRDIHLGKVELYH